jgi:hypothetical protein
MLENPDAEGTMADNTATARKAAAVLPDCRLDLFLPLAKAKAFPVGTLGDELMVLVKRSCRA